ncbi:hypothetical protein I6E29_04715 [Arcanobacterium haemolyticum]|nr:hypothetical protein [Arcanobacterium haemolyticum]
MAHSTSTRTASTTTTRFHVQGLNGEFSLPHSEVHALACDDLVVEYAPGHYATRDLTHTPGARAALLKPLFPEGSALVTWSALWVHTAWQPRPGRPRLTAAHANYGREPIVFRRTIPDHALMNIGGCAVTSPARTALDLLSSCEPSEALDGTFRLIHDGLTTREMIEALGREQARKRWKRLYDIVVALDDYVSHSRARPTSPGSR